MSEENKKKDIKASAQTKASWFDKLFEAFFKERTSIGLDIGSRSVKAVAINNTPAGPVVSSCGYKEIPFSDPSKTMDSDDLVAETIRDLWRDARIKGKGVRVVISDPSIYTRHILVPEIEEEELVKAIKWQAEKYVPFPIDGTSVDYQEVESPTKKAEGQKEVMVVAVENKMLEKYLDILRTARLRPISLNISPLAVARTFLTKSSIGKEDVLPILDIGEKSAFLIILGANTLFLVRKIDIAGSHFTKAIAKDRNINFNEAEKIKQSSSEQELLASLEPLFSGLVEEINRSLAYCERDFSQGSVRQLVLAGGGAELKGLKQYLSQKLGVSVELANPLPDNAILSKNVPWKTIVYKMMAALGEAI